MALMTPISSQIWDMKYRLKEGDGAALDKTMEDSWRRVASALAAPEDDPGYWQTEFYEALEDFRFLPAGRILAGAGTDRHVTLFNCFVMGRVPDDMAGIFDQLKEAALTMQQGGGIGYDFSTLRPKGAPVVGVGADASGPLTFMDVWDSMCRTIMSAGFRRGAMMGTLRCDHPDIEAFIEAKQDPGRLRMFNLSVLVSDDFMAAVKADRPWEQSFDGVCYKTVSARELWDRIMRATYAFAEPGVIFIDRINKANNLNYCEEIFATNPCGEQPLPPYGACLLGSINLASLVRSPFAENAALDIGALSRLVATSVRMLDNAISISRFPLEAQREEAIAKRRIGLGVTGLADALIMCRARYGSEPANALTQSWLAALRDAAYLTSARLAEEKGAFPLFDAEPYLASETVTGLSPEIRAEIERHGTRNALLTSIAPTGTISLLAGNISSGIEPVFSYSYRRNVLMPDGSRKAETVSDYAYRLFRELKGENTPLPDYFVDAQQLRPSDHLVVQALAQKYIDSSISKTINCPEEIGFDEFKDIYTEAFDLGCKGCTTYRPNPVTGAVMETAGAEVDTDGEIQEELPLKQPPAKPRDAYEAGGVVYMTQPLERPESLPGSTYKIRWPESDHAIYITINDIIRDGRRAPFEIFINSKNTEHYAWTVALTRMISAVFRRGGDISFVVEELKAVFDPRGGQWMDGRYVPSILAAIGEVIEHHLSIIGFARAAAPAAEREADADAPPSERLRTCPRCSQYGVIQQEGCDVCTACGYSKCA
ncbi:MAG: Vitamin B12-dependent ribonucleoside-diphosphate reductase [Alphaproteobacteria bacterium MarineAlpha10_Bin2]|nr:MAG: Vitamin B12-dependent ribonucleoside-diphosphate reductase [Alphaproteobacteria bacterium MarineAlpha10_Bin2]